MSTSINITAALLCAAILSACQANSQATSGVAISPPPDITDESQIDDPDTSGNTGLPDSNNSDTLDNSETSGNSETPNNSVAPVNSEAPNNSAVSDNSITIDQAQTTGNLTNSELTEVSGMAASTRQSNTFWALNDSGNAAKLFAFDSSGADLGSWQVNTTNRDWEDMASAWINGESYLLIAEIGDNLQVKNDHTIHVIVEPLLNDNATGPLEPLHTIRFRYPDAPHNAESLAVDDQWLYVLTKEPLLDGDRQQSRVYRIPLAVSGPSEIIDAELIAQLAIPETSFEASIIASLASVDVSQPTAFDIDKQNRTAYVLTYRSVYRYQREEGQSWSDVFAQPRDRVHSHSLSQAEALAIGENGNVWFTSEKRPAPLWALPP